ncbi:FkbM family methyltransferase [uncultured Aquimarina sp.]|uniref:FkbM family methyltransferase n=1 Tax=uncultured Aquimarina sp. TaxID=575652 RepID=UPI00260D13BE|nr:FkbM family methyltransferase [uncultured Aquimarina sp.]
MNITLRNYSFEIDPGQNKLMWEHINKENWEVHSFDIFDFFVPKNGVVLDIGAWSGVLSLYTTRKAKKVYALDPDPVCFKELQKNIALNPTMKNKISAHPIAISGVKEIATLSARLSYGGSSSSIMNRKRDTENSLQLTTVPLLNFIEQERITQIDFIKMDVEGAEFSILPTIGSALKKINYPTLYVSFHYGFLNEHIYHQYVSSRFLTKVFLKIEKITGLSFFKKKIENNIKKIYNDLFVYKYIYTTKGKLVSKNILKQQLRFIKQNDLIFTNTAWNS